MLAAIPDRLLVFVLGATALLAACSPSGVERPARSRLDTAIALYIDGDYEESRERLSALVAQLEGEEQLAAYLYLGRCHVALGDYDKAAEAFSTGRLLGGGPVFEEYLGQAQREMGSAVRVVRVRNQLTRGDLAALVEDVFGASGVVRAAAPSDAPADAAAHWAREAVGSVVGSGIMDTLPGGLFEPEREVTRAAFYVTVSRLARALSLPERAAEEVMPGGYRRAANAREGARLIAGSEAVEILERLRAKAGR